MRLKNNISSAIEVFNSLSVFDEELKNCVELLSNCFKGGKKILICGNGGSAADAQHLAAEFVGRYKFERVPLAAIALTTDTSALTAIGNDYNFDTVFSRQVAALGSKGDVFWGISTSGNSVNVLNALETAKGRGMNTILFLGNDGGAMRDQADFQFIINSKVTARIQEAHIFLGHNICEAIDYLWVKEV